MRIPSSLPRYTARRHRNKFRIKFKVKYINSDNSARRKDSYANVDMVVKAPMKPIVMKSLNSGETFLPVETL